MPIGLPGLTGDAPEHLGRRRAPATPGAHQIVRPDRDTARGDQHVGLETAGQRVSRCAPSDRRRPARKQRACSPPAVLDLCGAHQRRVRLVDLARRRAARPGVPQSFHPVASTATRGGRRAHHDRRLCPTAASAPTCVGPRSWPSPHRSPRPLRNVTASRTDVRARRHLLAAPRGRRRARLRPRPARPRRLPAGTSGAGRDEDGLAGSERAAEPASRRPTARRAAAVRASPLRAPRTRPSPSCSNGGRSTSCARFSAASTLPDSSRKRAPARMPTGRHP